MLLLFTRCCDELLLLTMFALNSDELLLLMFAFNSDELWLRGSAVLFDGLVMKGGTPTVVLIGWHTGLYGICCEELLLLTRLLLLDVLCECSSGN